jgi:hypothetical protein
MKRIRVQLSVARLMVIVAIAGLALGLPIAIEHRRTERLAIAADHEAKARKNGWSGDMQFGIRIMKPVTGSVEEKALSDLMRSKAAYHLTLERKYLVAARHPWSSVEDDPPEPQ